MAKRITPNHNFFISIIYTDTNKPHKSVTHFCFNNKIGLNIYTHGHRKMGSMWEKCRVIIWNFSYKIEVLHVDVWGS